MIDLMEKLVEADFADQFKPIDSDELAKRFENMDEDSLWELVYDHVIQLGLSGLSEIYNEVMSEDMEQHIFDILRDNMDEEKMRLYLLELIEMDELKLSG